MIWGVVAEIDGRIVGSNFLDERSPIGGVGQITVAPEGQNSGVGRKLMQAVLERGEGALLVASPFLRPSSAKSRQLVTPESGNPFLLGRLRALSLGYNEPGRRARPLGLSGPRRNAAWKQGCGA
jgi:GNAT superfamily N-acetyltransferase